MHYSLYQNQVIYIIYISLYTNTQAHKHSFLYHQFIILFKLFEKFRGLEIVRNLLVKSCDDFVDLFLPTRFGVLAGLHGVKELAEGDVQDGQKVFGNLK